MVIFWGGHGLDLVFPYEMTNFNPIKMINYRRLCRVTSSPYSHNLLHQTASYVNFNLCYLLAAFLLVNFVSSRFARFGGLFRHS